MSKCTKIEFFMKIQQRYCVLGLRKAIANGVEKKKDPGKNKNNFFDYVNVKFRKPKILRVCCQVM